MKAKENEHRVKELVEELRIREEENERQAQRILVLESALVLRQPVDARILPCGGCHSLPPKAQPKVHTLSSCAPHACLPPPPSL